jgi:hypothetical protein
LASTKIDGIKSAWHQSIRRCGRAEPQVSVSSTEKIFKLPQFEMKDFIQNDWKKVSEKEFLTKLAETFELIAPVLIEMFQGKEILTRDWIFRIQTSGANNSVTLAE